MDNNLNETPRDQSQTNRPIAQNMVPKDQVTYPPPNPYANQPYLNQANQSQTVKGVPPSYPHAMQMQAPGQYVPLQQPMLLKVGINQPTQISCSVCGSINIHTQMTYGCTAFSWCFCLFCFTGILCFWVPFVIDGCQDTNIVCSRCGFIINSVPAPCC